MIDDQLARIDELSAEELRFLLKQQVTRTYLSVKTRNTRPFRYSVANDSMWYMYRDANGNVHRQLEENFSQPNNGTIFAREEREKMSVALMKVLNNPVQPFSGTYDFNTKLWKMVRIEYETIVDKDGKVESIVGELVDLLRNEDTMSQTILSLNKRTDDILSLEQTYESIIKIDLRDYSFELIRATPAVKEVASRLTNAVDLVKMMNTYDIAPEHRGVFIDFLDEKTLVERMAGKRYLSQYFLSMHLGWIRVKLIPVSQDRLGNVEKVLYVSERSTRPAIENVALNQTSERDALTGLLRIAAGRRLVEEKLQSGVPFAMVQLKCDYFSSYVELLGNVVSEKIILTIGKVLAELFDADNCVHMQKEQFGLILFGEKLIKSKIMEGGQEFLAVINEKLTQQPIEEMGGLPIMLSGVELFFDGHKSFTYNDATTKLQAEIDSLQEVNSFVLATL